jgi:hypothetical protein
MGGGVIGGAVGGGAQPVKSIPSTIIMTKAKKTFLLNLLFIFILLIKFFALYQIIKNSH